MSFRACCRSASITLALASILGATACAGSSSDTDKQLASLRAELAKLRSTTSALTERLDAAELTAARLRQAPPPPDKPTLEVVKLAPPEASIAEQAEVDDGAPRTELRSAANGSVIEVAPSQQAASKRVSPGAEPRKPAAKKLDRVGPKTP
jgi:hypothetical protein